MGRVKEKGVREGPSTSQERYGRGDQKTSGNKKKSAKRETIRRKGGSDPGGVSKRQGSREKTNITEGDGHQKRAKKKKPNRGDKVQLS